MCVYATISHFLAIPDIPLCIRFLTLRCGIFQLPVLWQGITSRSSFKMAILFIVDDRGFVLPRFVEDTACCLLIVDKSIHSFFLFFLLIWSLKPFFGRWSLVGHARYVGTALPSMTGFRLFGLGWMGHFIYSPIIFICLRALAFEAVDFPCQARNLSMIALALSDMIYAWLASIISIREAQSLRYSFSLGPFSDVISPNVRDRYPRRLYRAVVCVSSIISLAFYTFNSASMSTFR